MVVINFNVLEGVPLNQLVDWCQRNLGRGSAVFPPRQNGEQRMCVQVNPQRKDKLFDHLATQRLRPTFCTV